MAEPFPRLRPLSPEGALPTPPDSPRKRRRELRESDDASGHISIEHYLYRSDPYRSTSVSNPLPYPLLSKDAPEPVRARVLAYHADILEILRDHGFHDQPAFEVVEDTKPGYPGGEEPVTMLRLLFRLQMVVPRVLGPAKDAIYDFLLTRDIYDVHVEIVHYDLCFKPSLFAIDPNHKAVEAYERAKLGLVEQLNTNLGSSWRVMCLFNFGLTEDKAVPAVVIMVDPGVYCDFAVLEISLRRQVTTEITIEFLPGGMSLSSPEPKQKEAQKSSPGVTFLSRMRCDSRIEMGCSIGVRGERGGGTMGVFVTLTENGLVRKGVLTNYHVVQPPSSADEDVKLLADRHGSAISRPDQTQVDVLYFAEKDIEATLQDANEHVASLEKEVQKLRAEQEERAAVGARIHPYMETRLGINEKALAETKEKLAVVKSIPLPIGKVLVSSGKSIVSKKIIDWAFVEAASPEVFGSNTMPHIPLKKLPSMYGHHLAVAPEGSVLGPFGKLEKGAYYVKVGRTTGLTAGICNGTLAYCNRPKEDQLRYDEQGNEVNVASNLTEEYVILDKSTGEPMHAQTSFCVSGDSGSFVLDNMGQICGLLYGELSGACGPPGGPITETIYVHAGLATSMSDVIQSVQYRTTPRDGNGVATGTPAILGLPGFL
ncbi:hypothetical protein DTO166G4_173 [Paecilomyces variotii]|nr:hypothetical protein DTO166G4_173 [Paecilomyces variotii]KAJ9227716.1 hypothetical protein DTO166G5_9218 [Paecilomyces variotii]KAJ9263359.1 hypothetical protein DTO195F2_3015 [Paecilomyces variotii]KAJ9283452.1 hypothetical protein DTO021C3_8983 [Paecilomyces variotii]KAJ9305175.1 hypothetical protein DTO217A2_5361 [Paecilomyces variotii]